MHAHAPQWYEFAPPQSHIIYAVLATNNGAWRWLLPSLPALYVPASTLPVCVRVCQSHASLTLCLGFAGTAEAYQARWFGLQLVQPATLLAHSLPAGPFHQQPFPHTGAGASLRSHMLQLRLQHALCILRVAGPCHRPTIFSAAPGAGSHV